MLQNEAQKQTLEKHAGTSGRNWSIQPLRHTGDIYENMSVKVLSLTLRYDIPVVLVKSQNYTADT